LQRIAVERGTYFDSVTLMLISREIGAMEGVEQVALNMATEANLRIMASAGFDLSGLELGESDLVIAVKGKEEVLDRAISRAKELLKSPPGRRSDSASYFPKSVDGALALLPGANLALISVAGQYAADVARACLDLGLNVMLYSDNVPLSAEVELKRIAGEKGLLVMGPDCGTAVIRGKGLGFANAYPLGPVGLVAAAGTGLQEVGVQMARRGVGLIHAIGTGGRDVKEEVGGSTFSMGVKLLLEDPEVEVLALVGKPPSPSVEGSILDLASSSGKPVVVGFVGGRRREDAFPLYFCSDLEEVAAVSSALAKGLDPNEAREELRSRREEVLRMAQARSRRGYLRGLFSGGTLCYEAQLLASSILGPIRSNAPLDKAYKLADSLRSEGHCMVDYGEDEFTQGRLHPMMDSSYRAQRLVVEAQDPEVSVILFDCVLGYGAHENPASQMAEAVQRARGICGDRVLFVSYVCGLEGDPQVASRQRRILEEAGVVLLESNAEAAIFAAACARG